MGVVKKKKKDENENSLSEAQTQFILKGGGVQESVKGKEKKRRILLEIPEWLFEVMDTQIKSRKRKISRVQWILDAIIKKLKIKDE